MIHFTYLIRSVLFQNIKKSSRALTNFNIYSIYVFSFTAEYWQITGRQRMLCNDQGLHSGSDQYFFSFEPETRELLFFIYSCGEFCADSGYKVERDTYHNSFLCFYVEEGSLSVTSGRRTQVAHKGMSGIIDCHGPHEYHSIGYTKFIWIHFGGSNSLRFYQAIISHNKGFLINNNNCDKILHYLRTIVETCRAKQSIAALQASVWVYQILLAAYEKGSTDIKLEINDRQINDGILYIKEHYSEPIQLADIAAYVNMSVYYFARRFKKVTGKAPHDFLLSERINMAKYLLKSSNATNGEIAAKVGYQSETGFVASFTERVGISPGKFREYQI